MRLRPFRSADYPRYVAIANACTPEAPRTEAAARRADDAFDAGCFHRTRLVAELAGGLVAGWGELGHLEDRDHPDTYFLDILVDPPHRGHGLGGALFDALFGEARERGAAVLGAAAKASSPAALRFLARRGFVETRRGTTSVLDLRGGKPAGPAPEVMNPDPPAIRITTLAALRRTRPDALAAAHRLFAVVAGGDEWGEPVPLEVFLAHVEAPNALPEGYFLALDGERPVGQSALFAVDGDPTALQQDLTGVLPSHRRRGIAVALKRAAISFATEAGYREIRTLTDEGNAPMRAINHALGFRPRETWVAFVHSLPRP